MMSPTGRTRLRSGLALVEVLVAVVLLFAGFTAILRVYSGAVAALDASEQALAQVSVLQQALESVPLLDRSTAPSAPVVGSDWSFGGRRYVLTIDRGVPPGGAMPALLGYSLKAGVVGDSGRWMQVNTAGLRRSP